MDTLAMHRTLTDAKLTSEQADAIIRVIEGGVATKQDLQLLQQSLALVEQGLKQDMALLQRDLAQVEQKLRQEIALVEQKLRHELNLMEARLAGRIERLENKVNLILGGVVLAVIAPAITRLLVG